MNDEAREYTATEAKVAHWTRNKNWGEIVKLHQDCSQLSEEEQVNNITLYLFFNDFINSPYRLYY